MEVTPNHSSVLADTASVSKSRLSGVHSLPYVTVPRRKSVKLDDVRSNGWLDAMRASSPPRKRQSKGLSFEVSSDDGSDTAYSSWVVCSISVDQFA